MNKPKIIAFGHESGVGKDTACQLLIDFLDENGQWARQYSIARKLKEMTCETFGLQEPAWWEKNREERYKIIPHLGMSYIDALVTFGECVRAIHGNAWINLCIKEIMQEADVLYRTREGEPANTPGQRISVALISDLRTYPEVHALAKQGATFVKIDSPRGKVRSKTDMMLAQYDGWNHVITNPVEGEDWQSKVRFKHELAATLFPKVFVSSRCSSGVCRCASKYGAPMPVATNDDKS